MAVLLTSAAVILLFPIRKKKESFHTIWTSLLKAFAMHICVQKCCFSNTFTWCVKIRIANRSSTSFSSPFLKCAYSLQLGCSLVYIYIFVSKGWVVYKQCCHVNLEDTFDREFWKCQAEAQKVGICFVTCPLWSTGCWRKINFLRICLCFSNWGLSFSREKEIFPMTD